MSDSYVVERSRVKVERKPPKKPSRLPAPWPWWASGYLALHFAVAYGLGASEQRVGDALLFGFCLLIHARDLHCMWSWRRWSKWAKQPAPSGIQYGRLDRFFGVFMVCCAVYQVVSDLLRFVLDGRLPGQ